MSREKIGKFEIIRHLARGGMADVFLARVEGLEGFEKLCVLKRMLPDLMASEEHVQMFLDEARIAGALHHANIVQVYDVGIADGKYFLAMEYLPGYDVSRLFRALGARGERMPLEQAVHIVASICAGLHHAHTCRDPHGVPMGIVHRDISPQNVFVTFDGHVKLMDFGIAKASKRSTRTRSGVLKGKLGYMAPEQAQGKRLDGRADIFATAVILWELTTGRRLHPVHNEYEILKAIVERPAPRPSTLRDGYPAELERIVMQGLSKDPSARYSTALEMQHDLEQLARDAGMTLAPTSLAKLMTQLFPEGHELGLTGANPIVGQVTIVDDDELEETDEGSFVEGRSVPSDLARDSLSTVPDTSPGWYAEKHVAAPLSGDSASAVVPLSEREPPSDARISRAATAELELQRPARGARSFAWVGVVGVGLLTLIAVGAFGYARSNDLFDEGGPDVSTTVWSPTGPTSATPTSSRVDATPDAAISAAPLSSSAQPVVSASAAPRPVRTGIAKPPKPRPPKPNPTKPAPTWDYDSPLPP